MAKVIEEPVVEGDVLVFRVQYGDRVFRAVVAAVGSGTIRVEGDLGAHNEAVSAVRAYASQNAEKIPEAYRGLPSLCR